MAERVRAVLRQLERAGTKRTREEQLTKYGITAPKAFGVKVGAIQTIAKRLGKDHALAGALWKTGWYEARLLCAYVDEPDLVTVAQMDRWAKDFDNWGVVDTLCFVLFDQAPKAWSRVRPWAAKKDAYVRRAGYVLLACLAAHDKASGDAPFLKALPLIEKGATDERNFVKKGVSWALRMVGRRSPALNRAAVELSQKLAASDDPTKRWIGRGALKELASSTLKKRLAATQRQRKS
jgi:3-methyladenine DNA glycosylase AlkD